MHDYTIEQWNLSIVDPFIGESQFIRFIATKSPPNNRKMGKRLVPF